MSAGLAALGIEWTRPLGLVALALPAIVLLAARIPGRPRELATGTLAIWRRVAEARPVRARARRPRVPPFVALVALALVLGALALAGPRPVRTPPARVWTLVVDVSPSTALPLDPSDPGSPSRRRAALDAAEAWARGALGDADELVRVELADPDWPDRDRPGTLFVTDRVPAYVPRHAGLAASGGPAVPGAVAVRGTTRVEWDGAELREVPGAARRPAAVCSAALPSVLGEVLEAWAAARDASVLEEGADATDHDVVLTVLAPDAPPDVTGEPTVSGRDGWTASGRVARGPSAEAADGAEVWLAADGVPLVTIEPDGRLRTRWLELEEPRGDPAAFAVSWAALFDRAARLPSGVVPLAERAAAGEAVFRPPSAPGAESGAGEAPRAPYDAWLAGLAALIALVALAAARPLELGRGARPGAQARFTGGGAA